MEKITLRISEEQEDALSGLVLALEQSLGSKVTFVRASVYEVESSDPRALAILQSVFDQPQTPRTSNTEKKFSRAKHTRKNVCYEITSGDEQGTQIAGGPLALRLKAGSIALDTTLRHPTNGDFVVKSNPDDPSSTNHFVLVEDPLPF